MADEQTLNSSWGTDTGLVSNFEADVVEAWFGVNERSTSDDPEIRNKIYLWWKCINITTDDDEAIDELTHRLSIGNGWEVADGGQRVVRADGNEKKKFNNSTGLGKVIDRVLGNGKEGEYHEGFKDLLPVLGERNADTRRADTWVGLRFRFDEASYPIKDRDTGQMTTYEVVLPTAYLGPAKVGSGGGGANPEPAAAAEPQSNGNGGLDREAALATLTTMAQGAEDHQSFLNQALSVPGVAQDQELLNLIATPEGLYAQARG